VCLVIGVESASLEAGIVPQVKISGLDSAFQPAHLSLVHSVIEDVLHRATCGLAAPSVYFDILDAIPMEIALSGASLLVERAVELTGDYIGSDAVSRFNNISALPYEGRSPSGRLILSKRPHPAISIAMEFEGEIFAFDAKAPRKILEASGEQGQLLLDQGSKVYGLGKFEEERYDPSEGHVFIVTITDRGLWELSHAGQPLMTVRDGRPELPKPWLDEEDFRKSVMQVLSSTASEAAGLYKLAEAVVESQHGAMLIISADAAGEAERFKGHARKLKGPVNLKDNSNLLTQLTSMDGGLLLDKQGQCHAIGIILDGEAIPYEQYSRKEDPNRGSRYNNAVRYVLKEEVQPAVVLVRSVDGGITILKTPVQTSKP
jgi:hypothetical protein